MKKLLTLTIGIFLTTYMIAQNYSISNLQFTPASPDTLLPGEFVDITYDYNKTGGDIRIGIQLHQTEYGGNYGTSGYSLKTDDIGSGTARFTFDNWAVVDSVTFRFVDLDWSLLYDTVVAVDYTWHKFFVNNMVLFPESPDILMLGDSIKYSFDYETSYIDNIKIRVSGISNGEDTKGQVFSEPQLFSETTGEVNGFIKVDSLTYVDQMLFQFLDPVSNDTLSESLRNVYYSFTNNQSDNYSVTNVLCNPPTPANLELNEHVNITFDYTKPTGDVRIYISPIVSEGSYSFGTSGSPLYTENSGSGNADFVFYAESKIEKIRFRIQSPAGIILYEYEEDVLFTYNNNSPFDYSISDVIFSPPSPESLLTGDTIKVRFNYTKPFGEVFFYIQPLKDDQINTGYEVPYLGGFSNNIDSVFSYIIYDIETTFDQVRIKMKTSLGRLLAENIIDVDYSYTEAPLEISGIVFSPESPHNFLVGDSVVINFNYKNLREKARIAVTPYKNRVAVSDFVSPASNYLLNNSGSGSSYFKCNSAVSIEQVKLALHDTLGNLLIEQLVDVNYTFNYPALEILQANLLPASPSSLIAGDTIFISFNYTNLFEKALVKISPFFNSIILADFISPSSNYLIDVSGKGESFLVCNNEATIDEIKLELLDTLNAVLFEEIINVDYTYNIPTYSKDFKNGDLPEIYPVPANKELTIKVSSDSFEYELINSTGQVLRTENVISSFKTLNVEEFEDGLYFIRIRNSQKSYILKVLLN